MNSINLIRFLYKLLFLIFFIGFFTYALQSIYGTIFLIYNDVEQIKLAENSCMDIYFHLIYWSVFFLIYAFVFCKFFHEIFRNSINVNRIFEIVTASYFMILFILVPLYLEIILALGRCK